MKFLLYLHISLILLFYRAHDVFPQDFIFEHLETKDGLSQVTINDIYQDELGRMWFATRDGLNRYDGNEIKIFKPIPGDSTSIPATKISALVGNGNGSLYMAISGNLVRFDIKNENFITLPYKASVPLSRTKEGIVWNCERKIYLLENQTDSVRLICELPSNIYIRKICQAKNGDYWLGGGTGLYKVNSGKISENLLPGYHIRHLLEDHDGNLWICSENLGLVKRTPEGEITVFRHDKGNPGSIVSDFVRTACLDNLGYLWIGSPDGLSRLNLSCQTFHNYFPQPENSSGLNFKSITCLYTDRQGSIWIGTYFGGINYLNPEFQSFKYYHPYKEGGLKFPVIGMMTEDKHGTIWMCTSGGYLSSFDPKTRKIQTYDEKQGISSKNLKSIWYDNNRDCIWLGSSDESLDCFDIKTLKAKSFIGKTGTNLYFGKRINQILDWNGNLLLGTGGIGVCLFDIQKHQTSNFGPKTSGEVVSIVKDKNNRIWIAGYGLHLYDPATGKEKHYIHEKGNPNSLSSNAINIVFEDSKQNIWIGTSGFGLNKYRPASDDFEIFTKEKNGLQDNNILALNESPEGKLLIGTNTGLSTFEPQENRFSNYEYKSGFPLTTINEGGLFVSRAGDIYIGGVPGLTVFKESDLLQIRKSFDINFSKLYLDNNEVKINDQTGVLTCALPFTKKIILSPKYSGFSIEFITNNYIKANAGDIQYRLIGYEDKWMDANLGRLITYTNLNPGEYKLEMRVKDFPNISKSLIIDVKPPFYRTNIAYISYVLLLIFLIYWFIKQSQIRFYLKTSLEFEKREKEKNEEMIQSKLRFFMNISHEIRTPVTLIIGQIENLLQSYSVHPLAYNKMLKIHKNANNLKSLISELLDFRKQEQGHLKLKISYVNFIDYLEEIFSIFQEYALEKDISLTFNYTEKDIWVWIDTKQMQKVIQNLLSNAFKYTPKGGTIKVSATETEEKIILTITDNGVGIAAGELGKVFDRFYQAETSFDTPGTGIGLALSKGIIDAHQGIITVESVQGKGSVFTITLKKGDAHFPEETLRVEAEKEISFYEQKDLGEAFKEEIRKTQKEADAENCRLLIVEDNDDLRALLLDIFTPFYQVETATDGLDALEKIKENQPDIIISDIMMPRMSGIEFCSEIKTNVETCHIPIILLTAKTAVEHKLEGLKIGADDYITKPFDVKLLVARCNNLVNNRKILQKRYIHQQDFPVEQITDNPFDLDFINRATLIVETNVENDSFDVDLFAREMGMGRTSFFNKLKGITGLTPLNFISNIKLKKASELLLTRPDMNVTDIAYYLGYSTPRYFNECFRDLFGCPPLTYRKKNLRDKH